MTGSRWSLLLSIDAGRVETEQERRKEPDALSPRGVPVASAAATLDTAAGDRPASRGLRSITMRSISSSVIASAVRSYSFVVFGDAWAAIRCACSSVPPVRQGCTVTPVAPNV